MATTARRAKTGKGCLFLERRADVGRALLEKRIHATVAGMRRRDPG
jgi:hypothetical protein